MVLESSTALSMEQRASLIRSYGNLYAQSRVETLEWLDKLDELRGADELKSKLLFSVIVVSDKIQSNKPQHANHFVVMGSWHSGRSKPLRHR